MSGSSGIGKSVSVNFFLLELAKESQRWADDEVALLTVPYRGDVLT